MGFHDAVDRFERRAATTQASPLALALMLAVLPLLLAHVVFTPIYRLNDDTGMDLLVRGVGLAASPTPFILYSNVLYGKLLVTLYGVAPDLPWYRLAMLTAQFVSSVSIVWAVFRRGVTLDRWVAVIVYLLVFDLYFYVSSNFTITAGVAAAAAMAVWLSTLHEDEAWGLGAGATVVGLLVLSSIVRNQAMWLILALTGPACAIVWFRQLRASRPALNSRRLVLFAATLLTAVILGQAAHLYDRAQYAAADGWQEFHELDDLMTEFIDFERARYAPDTRHVFEAVGWSQNDFLMLMNWFYSDEELFNIENSRRVVDAFPVHRFGDTRMLAEHWSRIQADRDLPLMIAALVLVLLAAVGERRSRGPVLVTLMALAGLVIFLVFFLDRFPARVYQPMLVSVAVLCSVVDSGTISGISRSLRPFRLALLLLVVVLFGATTGRLHAQTRAVVAMNATLREAMRQLDPQPTDLYVVWGASFPYEAILPLERLDYLGDFEIFSLGADTRSPVNLKRLDDLGTTDIHRAIYRRSNVYVISNPYQNRILEQYVAEHHDVRIRAEAVRSFRTTTGPVFDVYRFREIGGPATRSE